MAKLIYTALLSLDGYMADADGNFDWAEPDEEVHRFVNDLERPVDTYLLGRRTYDLMLFWDTADLTDLPPYIRDFAEIWRAADKIVFSRTLQTPAGARTRIERNFDLAMVRQMKATTRADISVGGPDLAAQAIRAGLVDEYHLIVFPVLLGGGKRALPDNVRAGLELLDVHRFGNGAVHLHHRAVIGRGVAEAG